MSRSRSTTAALLFALLAPSVFGSCVDDSVSLRITCSVVPDTDCTYSEGGLCWLQGTLNVNTDLVERGLSYGAVLRVTNGLKPREREVPPLSETNGIQIHQMEVTVKDSAGNKPNLGNLPNPYTVPATGFIEPSEDGLVGADLLPNAYVRALSSLFNGSTKMRTVNLSVFARGKTNGDVEVESGTWPWYINLVGPSPIAGNGQCVASEDEVCGLGQDGFAYACNPATVTDN